MAILTRLIVAALAFLGLLAGCAPSAASRLKLSDDVERPARNVVIFFGDGMDVQRLHEMLEAGLLPNIRRTFLDGGVEVRDGFSSMPCITCPNCSTIVTGLYPGHHGIMGNSWFDRDRAVVHNYVTFDNARDVNHHLEQPTLYDMLADRLTVSILAQTHKGATESFDLKEAFDWNWALGKYLDVDRAVADSFVQTIDVANSVRRWPTVIMTYYPGIDELGHRFGPDSSQFVDAVTHLDETVGRVTATMGKLGQASSTYYALIADHGMVPIRPGQDFGFIDWLKTARKLRVLNTPLDGGRYTDRLERLRKFDAVATVEAGRVAMVHLRGRQSWLQRPGPDEVRAWAMTAPAVHELPAVEMVASRGGSDRARLWSRHGSLTVERRVENGRKLYRIAEYTGDPLALRQSPKLARFAGLIGPGSDEGAAWHDSREWLAASVRSRYPDLVAQVVEMFDSSHTADLVVFAVEGWLLYDGERAGHGSTLYRDMHVPMFFAGPDLPAGTQIPLARLVDFTPTLLGLLGESGRLKSFPPVDGVDLSDQLRHATPAEPAAVPPPTPPRALKK